MALYEYRCRVCGKTLEVMQKYSDPPLTVHEDCGGQLDKLVSTSALKFKGSGWYVNDYARGGSASKGDQGNGKPAAKPETKTGTKTETKTESKPAPKPAPDHSDHKA